MKKDILIAVCSLFALIFSISFAAAETVPADSLAESSLADTISSLSPQLAGQKLPGPAGTLFGEVQINLFIALQDGEQMAVSIITKDKAVQQITVGELEHPDVKVYIAEETIQEIINAANPVSALQHALQGRKITYTAVGVKNKIKFAFLSSFVKIASMFSLKEEAFLTEEQEGQQPASSQPSSSPLTVEKEEMEQEIEKAATEEKKQKEEGKKDELSPELPLSASTTTHIVTITAEGFEPEDLAVTAGDSVIWKNARSGSLSKAMVLGTRQCVFIKSPTLETGQMFNHTFITPGTCTFVDGIITTQLSTVTTLSK